MADQLLAPEFEYAFELRVEVEDALPVGGRVPDEGLHFAAIVGGEFDGPLLSGRVLPGGGDWWVGSGLTARLDARYLIEARTGNGPVAIDVVNRGYWRISPSAADRLEVGEVIGEDELYYRTAFVFQTECEELHWLVASQFVGYARPEPGRVVIRVFRLR